MPDLRSSRSAAHIDLETIRETIAYMHSDLGHAPGLERVRDALGNALVEIDAHMPPKRPTARIIEFMRARFVPWTPGA